MKKIFVLLLAVFLVFAAGCSGQENTVATDAPATTEEKAEAVSHAAGSAKHDYTIVTTGQSASYDNEGNIITPADGEAFYGQDAVYESAEFSFADNGDGTITDNVTGLMWQAVPISEKMNWEEAVEYCENLEFAGYDDWRLPSVKEGFSISDFSTGWPFADTDYFDFPEASESSMPSGPQDGGPQGGAPQGDASGTENTAPPAPQEDNAAGEGETDSDAVSKAQGQFWTSNYYLVGTTHGGAGTAFGVNHATGHIKGYPADSPSEMGKYVRAVRGDVYGENDFVDNNDGTVTDEATGLMWMQCDIGEALEWEDALAFAENSEYAGYDDWRLPDVKELQSIVDYSGVYPAVDEGYFSCTELEENEFYYFWTNTSAYFSPTSPGYGYAWYVAFGYAVDDEGNDTHGAGAVRFSPKSADSSYAGEGGDNIFNSVRLVRNIAN